MSQPDNGHLITSKDCEVTKFWWNCPACRRSQTEDALSGRARPDRETINVFVVDLTSLTISTAPDSSEYYVVASRIKRFQGGHSCHGVAYTEITMIDDELLYLLEPVKDFRQRFEGK